MGRWKMLFGNGLTNESNVVRWIYKLALTRQPLAGGQKRDREKSFLAALCQSQKSDVFLHPAQD